MNTVDDQIRARFGFLLPDDYKRFWTAGLLANDAAVGIKVSRHFWLSPADIAECAWPRYRITSLVPCARTPGRDHYCWFNEPNSVAWVAECPRDSNFGEGVAPGFEAFVFRSVLEEYADSWITSLENAPDFFRSYASRLESVMRRNWVDILSAIASRDPSLNRWNRPSVISDAELSSIILREISFPMMNREFKQNIG